jgi:ABC-type xylose transport system permease subunit
VGNIRSGNCGVDETNRKVKVYEIYSRSDVDVSLNVVMQTLIIIIIIIIIIITTTTTTTTHQPTNLENNSNYTKVVYSY